MQKSPKWKSVVPSNTNGNFFLSFGTLNDIVQAHLLARVLSKQSNAKLLPHPFSNGRSHQIKWLQSDSYANGMPAAIRSAFDEEIRKGTDSWREALSEAQNTGKVLIIQTHPFFPGSQDRILSYLNYLTSHQPYPPDGENVTLIPNNLLLHPTTIPIFLIRDPRLTVPSAYRTMAALDLPHGGGRANYLVTTCNIWSRLLYDFYVSNGVKPLVVDADDFMTREDFLRRLCSEAGLDPGEAYLAWPTTTPEEKEKIPPNYYASQSTLINSSGLDPSRAPKNVDLEGEERKWEAEFGEDLMMVREMVELAMPQYQYLRERRLKM